MIDIAPLLKMFPIFAVALIIPGPDFMIVSSMALVRGRLAGAQAAAGIAAGVIIYVMLSLCGLAALFARFVWAVLAVKIIGGLYLIYLGVMVWRAANAKNELPQDAPKATAKNPFIAGCLTNLTNPKAVAFFTSIFALTITPDTSAESKMALVAMMGMMALTWFVFVAFSFSSTTARKSYNRARKVIDRVAGAVMIVFGVKLLSSATD